MMPLVAQSEFQIEVAKWNKLSPEPQKLEFL